tara:strand:- start:3639 stop:3830 length:192 start_codon:yes stop_codon:yes gene_type:complete
MTKPPTPTPPTSSAIAVEIIRAIEKGLAYTAERRANKPMRFIEALHRHGYTIVSMRTGPETKT